MPSRIELCLLDRKEAYFSDFILKMVQFGHLLSLKCIYTLLWALREFWRSKNAVR
jgi:hypothetical protein